MKRGLLIGIAALLFIAALIWKTGGKAPVSPLTGQAMGTTWTLAWRGDPPPHLHREVAATLEHWEQVLSKWREDSHVSQFNRGQPASPDLQRVMGLAEAVHLASSGAFDHHILADVHAAGYGPPGQGIDLSAIGEGFTVDRVGEKLRQLGLHDFVFELGGEVLVGDGDWSVEIERPEPGVREISRTLILRNRALATSGNYRQPGHIIDPRTRKPVQRPPSSVSVLAPDCATADAWATALFVLGPEFKDIPTGIEVTWQPRQNDLGPSGRDSNP